ncbi:MAG: FG-GAP-like repeat-containing protein [Myxococcota bacterium]|nr:FG-GAP-like repeat-containing protein [Myxococcota bacterium]
MLLLLSALACSDYEIVDDNDATTPKPDTGVDCPPQIPDCHDTDEPVDTDIPQDSPVDPDCEVKLAAAKTVSVVEECDGTTGVSGTIKDAFDLSIEYQYTSSGSGVIVMPAIGNMTDDNGDGQVDERDIPDIAFTTWTSNELVLLSGDGSGEIFKVSGYNGQGGVTIADVDADGEPEIVAFTTGNQIAAVNASGSQEWTSSSFGLSAYPQPTVADLDADGKPEVIGDVGIVNGEDGTTVATIGGLTNSWRTPVAADIDQDGTQEVILANQVVSHTGASEWTNPGTGAGNFAALANIDSDKEAEVFFVSGSTLYIHQDDGTLIRSATIPGTNPGPPSIADFDGDGQVEIAIPANTRLSVFEVDGSKVWESTINDSSGLAGCSGYDMNNDGAYEVLYADQDALRIYDGATGAILYENFSHSSGTVWEYPVIADVDQDKSAEICIASNSYSGGAGYRGITCFGHNGDGWPESGPTWGTHDYALTNVLADGSVPKTPDASWEKFNVFRARPSVDDPARPDLGGAFTDFCLADCDNGPVRVSFQVWNEGGEDIEAGLPYTVYAVNNAGEEIAYTGTLPAIPSGTAPEGVEFALTPQEWGDFGIIIRLDDDGTGTEGGTLGECDESDNVIEFYESVC